MNNIFNNLPDHPLAEEQFIPLISAANVTIERIVSTGQTSPAGTWFDQPRNEWVILLQGSASLRFEDEATARELQAGDHLHIVPHRRHRIEHTCLDEPTVWLAVHYD
ncbi:MAG TPA: cupin [Accumulibacter sp.]|nr:cupin [Accumulibacter sp.]HMW16527.1 cupin [Accumulibacter sp.]HMX21369.1 cupin [Accumulibacter sp.]HMY06124.1 cupin [Accumulibacter sp.]HNC18646.1 cupin [Accumulibacter sp.]